MILQKWQMNENGCVDSLTTQAWNPRVRHCLIETIGLISTLQEKKIKTRNNIGKTHFMSWREAGPT